MKAVDTEHPSDHNRALGLNAQFRNCFIDAESAGAWSGQPVPAVVAARSTASIGQARSRLRSIIMPFTAHNVRLADGTETFPELGWLTAAAPTCKASLKALRFALGGELKGKNIVDLGCLEGGYTAEFARAGMDALGIEARQSNLDNCSIVRDGLGLPNLDFVKDDVMNIDNYGMFDAAYCNGILYHLDKPREFLGKISGRTRRVIIVHTHFAMEEIGPKFETLSEITENEGLRGRWFIEHNSTTDDDAEQYKWSSWKNHRSFWPMKSDLIGLLYSVGFDFVFEQFDWIKFGGAKNSGDYKDLQRIMIVGVKSGVAG